MATRDTMSLGQRVEMTLLAKRNYHLSVPIADEASWREIAASPEVPTSYGQLRRLVASTRPSARPRPYRPDRRDVAGRGHVKRRFPECGEATLSSVVAGLRNPRLTVEQREGIERDLDADLPSFDQSHETEHFILRWTSTASHTADNISDATIVTETAGYLEAAWTTYHTVFGVPPYVAPGMTKIEVVFYDIGGFGGTTPTGPIELDAPSWVALPGIRQPTSAHELFHRVQYAFGYRTTWTPSPPYQWFSEGTASWAEVFQWQRVSFTGKITDLFTNPDLNLENATYGACPFWLFFQTRNQDAVGDNAMVTLLQKYQMTGNENTALEETIDEDWPANNVYGQLDTFFALFSRERRTGAWKQTPTGTQPYATILDPDGNAINPTLAITTASLGSGDSYTTASAVSALGTDYYRLAFEPDADGRTLTVSVTTAAGGNYSYYLIWEKGSGWSSATFPFAISGDHAFSHPIALATADALLLAISGRGAGGTYTLTASVS